MYDVWLGIADSNDCECKNVTCNDDWNIGLRRCPEKMSSLGVPTLQTKNKTKNNSELIYWKAITTFNLPKLF